jgi:predicted ArsR family transcriptional regulator
MVDTAVHRALAVTSRAEMLALLQTSTEGLGVADIGERTGLRPTTVRAHLDVLQQAGLVHAQAEERSTPGRPRIVYRAAEESPTAEAPPHTGYQLLAEILAGYLASTRDDTAGAATDAGEQWGHFLVDRVAPLAQLDDDAAMERLRTLLDQLGFAPEPVRTATGWEMGLHACPFRDIAQRHPEVACSVHLGIMRGALDELGVPLRASRLQPFAEPNRCVATMERGGREGGR